MVYFEIGGQCYSMLKGVNTKRQHDKKKYAIKEH